MRLPEEDRRRIGAYLGLGWAFAAAVGMFVALGWLVDDWLETGPIFTVIGMLVGAAAGFYYLVSHALAIERGGDDRDKDNQGSSGPSAKARDEK